MLRRERGNRFETLNIEQLGVNFPDNMPSILVTSPKFDVTTYVLAHQLVGNEEIRLVVADIDWVKVKPPERNVTFEDWLLTKLDELREKYNLRGRIELGRTALYLPYIVDADTVTLRRNRVFFSKDGKVILNCFDPNSGRTLPPPLWGLDLQAEYLALKDENEMLRHLLTRKETTIENLMRALRHWDQTINHVEAMMTQWMLLFSQSHAERIQLRQHLWQMYSQVESEKGLREAMEVFKNEYYRLAKEEIPRLLLSLADIIETAVRIGARFRIALESQSESNITKKDVEEMINKLENKVDTLKDVMKNILAVTGKMKAEEVLEMEGEEK